MTDAGFETVSLDAWWARVEGELGGKDPRRVLCRRLLEGIEVEPVYAGEVEPERGAPGAAPWTRGTGTPTRNAPRHRHPDRASTTEAIREDVARGADAVVIALDDAESGGVDVETVADLGALVDAAGDTAILFEADHGGRADSLGADDTAALLGEPTGPLWLGLDPWGTLARTGNLPAPLDACVGDAMGVVQTYAENAPDTRVLTLSLRPHHDAGATATDELAYAAATLIAALRGAEAHGVPLAELARRTALSVSIGPDIFVEIAKLRALRSLWGRITQACGVDAAPAVHAVTSARSLSRRDPWVNLLRATTATFAAICGGADVVTTACFDDPFGPPSALGRRVARNTLTVLAEESHLAEVTDPAGGSWYVEHLTESLAREAWARLQAIEAAGGMGAFIESGALREQLAERWEARRDRLRRRKLPLTGVSEYATDDTLLQRPSWPERNVGHRAAPAVSVAPLPRHRDAEDFERLRDAADAVAERPKVFLAALGPLPEHKPRVSFSAPFFASGGIATVAGEGTGDLAPDEAAAQLAAAFGEIGTSFAFLCGSDDRYASHAVAAAKALRAAGATRLFHAGRPPDEAALRAAGVDGFLFLGADVVATLEPLLEASS